jgi:hypothetical protein
MDVEYISKNVVVKVEKSTMIMAGTTSPKETMSSSTIASGVGDLVARAALNPIKYIQELTKKYPIQVPQKLPLSLLAYRE